MVIVHHAVCSHLLSNGLLHVCLITDMRAYAPSIVPWSSLCESSTDGEAEAPAAVVLTDRQLAADMHVIYQIDLTLHVAASPYLIFTKNSENNNKNNVNLQYKKTTESITYSVSI